VKKEEVPKEIAEFESLYDFPLDEYQRQAIEYLHDGRSALVVAPTGSGKTVVAEFGVWLAEREKGKTFYTTPLKALSNQKFRDFSDAYGSENVGLLTGDNSINGEAPVVVMTTEVLRNMIYERSPTLEGLRFVVLDEVHYLMDPFRGPVWEEIIIQLPLKVKIIGLSATVSNYREFGEWLNDLRGEVEVIYNDHRTVPLRDYYMIGGIMVNLLSSRSPQVVIEYEKSMTRKGRPGGKISARQLIPRRADVITRLQKSGMLPAIYFIFSRVGCDAGVTHCMEAGIDLTSPAEKEIIEDQVLLRMSWLPEEDLRVFGFKEWLEALKRGISSHHAGHLPIFKEVVEDLFQQGLVRAVFATETLSLGINMPAKTVVIESLYKFSGESHEFLTPTEYTQLTGRAGRRGIDKVGNAVTLYNPIVPFNQIQTLAQAESVPIRSSFSLSYNMAMNLLRFYDMETAVHVLNSSFAQFHADRDVVHLEKSRGRLAKKLRTLSKKISCERGEAQDYFRLRSNVSGMEREMAEERKRRRRELVNRELEELLIGDVIVLPRKGSRRPAAVLSIGEDKYGNPRLNTMDNRGHFLKVSYHQFPVPPQTIGHLGTSFLPANTKAREKKLREALQNFEVPPPDEREEELVFRHRAELTAAQKQLQCTVCDNCENREQCMQTCQQMQNINAEIERIEREMAARSDVSSHKLADVLRILTRLGYVEDNKPTSKGLVLSRIYNECDLLLVECLEDGVFDRLDPIELACFSSIFVFESRERSAGRRPGARGRAREPQALPAPPTPILQEAITSARAKESQIKSLEAREKLDLLRQPDSGFTRVIYDWASGESLEYMMSHYPQYSAGDFVRNMKQVIDIMRQIKEVTKDQYLEGRMSEAMDRIHRSIVAYTSVVDVLGEELESV